MKKIARVLLSSILKTTLFTAAMLAGVVGITGSATNLKDSLSDSGVYQTVVSDALNATANQAGERPEGQEGLNINSEPVIAAAEAGLTQENVQTTTETIIDNVFAWLNGDIETPNFSVDLSDAKARFIAAAGKQAEKHVAGLPACTAAQLRTIDVGGDPFSLECQPPGLSPAEVRQQVETELAGNEEFLADPVLTADNLGKKDDGTTVFQDLQGVPEAFQRAKNAPYILLLASALLATGVFFLSETRRRGARNLGTTLLGTGIFVLLAVWLTSLVFGNMISPEGAIGRSIDNSLQTSLLAILRSVLATFRSSVFVYGLAYVALGGATLLALKFFWKEPATATATPATRPVKGKK